MVAPAVDERGGQPDVRIVVNWFEELKEKVGNEQGKRRSCNLASCHEPGGVKIISALSTFP